MLKKVVLGGDHLTLDVCKMVRNALSQYEIALVDCSAKSKDQVMELTELIPNVVNAVRETKDSIGVLICGTGAGVEIGANKFRSIRATLCLNGVQAKNARQYDNANVLCLGSWLTNDQAEINDIINAFLKTNFDNDPGRTHMLEEFEKFI